MIFSFIGVRSLSPFVRLSPVVLVAVPPPRHAARRGAAEQSETGRKARHELSGRRPVRGQLRDARSGRRAGALARDGCGSAGRRGGRVGLAGPGARVPASGSSPGRGRPVCTQPPPRASSASQRLSSPAFRSKSFRGHAESTASSASRRPPATSQIRRLQVHHAHWSPRLNFRPSLGLAVFPGGPFEDFRGEVTSPVFLPP